MFIFANIRMRNVMKWRCAASSSADVEISSSSWKQLLDNIVLAFTITKTCGIHLHHSYKYILFPPLFLPLWCKPSALLASLYFMIICACMLIARYISWSIHQIFSASFPFSFPTGIKPLFVRACKFWCICKAWYSWRWNGFLLGERKETKKPHQKSVILNTGIFTCYWHLNLC